MSFIYAFFIAFVLIFISELGDKTQLIVLSFCNRLKTSHILIGIAIGTLFSHGVAIMFGSHLGLINDRIHFYLSAFTYISFIIFGILGFKNNNIESNSNTNNSRSLKNLFLNCKLHLVLLIAISIFVGEIGDKTFLASLGLGVQYPYHKIPLIIGAIMGMVLSNSLAIIFGKFVDNKINTKYIRMMSNWLFIIFGIFGFLKLIVK